VEDICAAISCALDAPTQTVNGEIFNVGSAVENYRIREIAEIIAGVFPGCEVTMGSSVGDKRSYRVNFDKINRHLPKFQCAWDADKGVKQFYDLFQQIDFTLDTFEYRAFTRLKQLQYLVRTGQLVQKFFWKTTF
jgi:nucleoside-diphosphate-sugar epimerase